MSLTRLRLKLIIFLLNALIDHSPMYCRHHNLTDTTLLPEQNRGMRGIKKLKRLEVLIAP